MKELNHVLLTACRADETAADATIDGEPTGAFTHFLCQTLRDGGAELDRLDVIDRITTALRNEHFPQDPQLEGADETGPLFGPGSAPGKPRSSRRLRRISRPMPPASSLTPSWPQAWSAWRPTFSGGFSTSINRAGGRCRRTDPIGRAVASGAIVYVHGICTHLQGFSDGWWDALHPFTTAFGAGERGPGGTRDEVVWSDLVNARRSPPPAASRPTTGRGWPP